MNELTPLQILLDDFLTPDQQGQIEGEAHKAGNSPAVKTLGSLRTPQKGNDPTELIENRFLYRGGICLLLGPTGVGKSSLLMQMAIHFSVGKELFGVQPGSVYRLKGMRVLIIQAENDEGDLAEMRDGVIAGCDLSQKESELALERISVCTITDKSNECFTTVLDEVMTEHPAVDILMVDPAFSYLGGDSNSQRDVSRFMRELLNPLLHRHQVGMILAHHTNKPARGKEKESWKAGDYAYLGAGSAEWINPARAALAIRSIGSDTIFELRAPKRGKRLRWEDEQGNITLMQHIAHHRQSGVICWRQAEHSEVEELLANEETNKARKFYPIDVLHCVHKTPGMNQSFYKDTICDALKCSETAVQKLIKECHHKDWLRFKECGREKLYHLTKKGLLEVENCPSAVKW